MSAFVWKPVLTRVVHDTGLAVGIQRQVARYLGQDVSGAFICTVVAVRGNGRWAIVNMQLGQPEVRASAGFVPDTGVTRVARCILGVVGLDIETHDTQIEE